MEDRSSAVTETFLKAAREGDAQPARFSTPAEETPRCIECGTAPREVHALCTSCYVRGKL
jgi:hypothetical protein